MLLKRGGVLMAHVFSECTVCFCNLTAEEVELNREKENYYYTICEECLEKYSKKIIEIVNND